MTTEAFAWLKGRPAEHADGITWLCRLSMGRIYIPGIHGLDSARFHTPGEAYTWTVAMVSTLLDMAIPAERLAILAEYDKKAAWDEIATAVDEGRRVFRTFTVKGARVLMDVYAVPTEEENS